MPEDWVKSVVLLAKVKYELDKDILEEYVREIEKCWYNNYTPRRTVEHIARIILDLKD